MLKNNNQQKTKLITFLCTEEQKAKLDFISTKKFIHRSVIIRQALDSYLDSKERNL